MNELIWINGEVMDLSEARISVEDRGFQFADGVYEVVRIYNGRAFTLAEHMARLERSCGGIGLAMPMPVGDLAGEIERFIPKSGVTEGMVYLQITRGAAARNHVFSQCRPTLLFYTRSLEPASAPGHAAGVKLWAVADERWKRCWIKSIALLPNVLAKNTAVERGADEAVFVEDGLISECSTSNFFAVRAGRLITCPVGPKVLPGVTRLVLLEVARQLDVPVEERALSEAEAMSADELFITSTTREVSWVSHLNGRAVRPGHCGPVSLMLHQAYQQRVVRQTHQ